MVPLLCGLGDRGVLRDSGMVMDMTRLGSFPGAYHCAEILR